ncbi:heat-inducible transcriptional repressor HrcA [Oceanobacillus halotolerans]|uniref:heat-inducible transcriptional repressor HrcA n=1 Tax=Oceanobacillus halotolerans TaxID=2663380 RepID=UPI0013DCC043|nr:heat-inducible transcriptional repressor HrcA [Oceanobacillus halotolerans]
MLTNRQLLILQVIIDDFIETALPVGSRAIAKREEVPFSPATIRNDMADLEDMGYLEKTHSSSGRVPSEKGYRYYVDHIISPYIASGNINVLEHIIEDGFIELEQVVQKTAEVLSDLTNYTSIILGPEIFEAKLRQLQFVTTSPQTAVAILVTNTGHVEHRSFTVPNKINASDLEKMVNILNDRLYNVPLVQLPHKLNREIVSLMKNYVDDFERTYDYLKAAFLHDHPVKLYVSGKTNILMQPEFKDVEKIRSFYRMMENEDEIASLLKNGTNGIKVTIGNENKIEAIKDFSLITAPYRLGDNQMGTIALLGPTRMEYKKVITLLNTLSHEMTDVLHVWYKQN